MTKPRARWAVSAGAVLCLVFAAPVLGCTAENAPNFTLPDPAGKESDFRAILAGKKAVLLNFWATWCPSCRHEIPDLAALEDRLSSKGFAVVGIDVGEPAGRVTAYQIKAGIRYPVLLDARSETAKQYGVVGLPESVLVGADGEILGRYREYSDALVRDVEKALQ